MPSPPDPLALRAARAAALQAVAGLALWKFLPSAEKVRERGFGDYVFSDPGRICRGPAALARRTAVVDSSLVYAKIPECARILRESLSSDKRRYHLLIQKALQRFSRAVSMAAANGDTT